MIRLTIRIASGSPSTANGTFARRGRDPPTNVISGCADATAAPRRRKECNSSLESTPLECSATRPLQSIQVENDRATLATCESGTQNHTRLDLSAPGNSAKAIAPTSFAIPRARFLEEAVERPITASITYPARCKDVDRELARFPAPTIVIVGLNFISGSIADGVNRIGPSAPGRQTLEAVILISWPIRPVAAKPYPRTALD